MQNHHFDPESGEYQGSDDAHQSPLEPGVWLLPAHATRVAPPVPPPDHALCWRPGNTHWEPVRDWRRAPLYRVADGQPYQPGARLAVAGGNVSFTGLGELPPWLTAEPRPSPEHRWTDGTWQLDIALLRAKLHAEVSAHRYSVETGGIVVEGWAVGTDERDQMKLTGAVASVDLAGIEFIDWKLADASWQRITPAQLRSFAVAVAQHVQACFSAERAHHSAIDAAPDIALPHYDLHQGWPGNAIAS